MENSTIDFEQIEQELQELKSRFSSADRVLRALEDIQIQFESLAKTHEKLKEYVEKVTQFNSESKQIRDRIRKAQEDFEQRFTELSDGNQLKTDNLKSEISEFNQKLNKYFTDSKSDLNSLEESLNKLERDFGSFKEKTNSIEQQLDLIQKASNKQKKQMRMMKKGMIVFFGLWLLLAALLWWK